MKNLKALIALVIVLAMTSVASARGMNRGGHGAGGHGKGSSGIEGTVSAIGTRGFTMSLKDGKSLKVMVDNNTKFMQNGEAVIPDTLKEGTIVAIVGSTLGTDEVLGLTVTIEGSDSSKKTPKNAK